MNMQKEKRKRIVQIVVLMAIIVALLVTIYVFTEHSHNKGWLSRFFKPSGSLSKVWSGGCGDGMCTI